MLIWRRARKSGESAHAKAESIRKAVAASFIILQYYERIPPGSNRPARCWDLSTEERFSWLCILIRRRVAP